MTLVHRLPMLVIPAALCCALTAGVVLRAQVQPAPAPAPSSFADLIAEVRQLRATVEDSNRRQSHIQMLSVYLAAQQSRLVETANRLEATRRQLSDAAQRTAEGERVVKMFAGDQDQATPSPFPSEAGALADIFKPQLDAAKAREHHLRAREAEMVQALQIEEARWTDLMARLEQSVKQ